MHNCGMIDFGNVSFGIYGIMSGLYIEKVWFDSDETFNSYMEWVKTLINNNKTSNNEK